MAVVFTSDRPGFTDEWPLTWFPQPYGDLWAVPVAGGGAIRLTHDKWEDGPSDWGYLRLRAPVMVRVRPASRSGERLVVRERDTRRAPARGPSGR